VRALVACYVGHGAERVENLRPAAAARPHVRRTSASRQGAERGARIGGPPSATSRARHHTARSQTWALTWHRQALEAAEQQALDGYTRALGYLFHRPATLWQDMQVPAGREAARLSVLGMQSMPAMRARAPRSVPGISAAARQAAQRAACPSAGRPGARAPGAVRTDDRQLARLELLEQLLVACGVDVAKEPAPPRTNELRCHAEFYPA